MEQQTHVTQVPPLLHVSVARVLRVVIQEKLVLLELVCVERPLVVLVKQPELTAMLVTMYASVPRQ